jgi:hypothetical protein
MQSKHLQTIAHALVLVAIMLGLIAAALWIRLGPSDTSGQAQAQNYRGAAMAADGGGVPDSGKQRLMMVDQLDSLNKHIADLEKGFRDGAFVVQTIEAKGAKSAKEEK